MDKRIHQTETNLKDRDLKMSRGRLSLLLLITEKYEIY